LSPKPLVVLPLLFLLAACGEAAASPEAPTALPFALTWEHDASVIVFQADTTRTNWSEAERLNHIPECTLFGDGRLVWVHTAADGGHYPVMAMVDDTIVQTILLAVVNSGFLNLPAQAEAADVSVSAIHARFSDFDHTVVQGVQEMPPAIENLHTLCSNLGVPAQPLLPEGAWLTVLPRADVIDAAALWPGDAPRTLADLAAGGEPVWAQGDLLVVAWYIVQAYPTYTAQEGPNQYILVMQVPGVTADAPPAP
jgi:hypothetical protein